MNVIERLEDALRPDLARFGDFPAVFAFSVHKAGSSLMNGMINALCRVEEIPTLDLPAKCFHLGMLPEEWSQEPGLAAFFGPGRVYHGFRQLPEVLLDSAIGLRESKIVLLVRDPRDAVVSQYYSLGGKHFSHARPKANSDLHADMAKRTANFDIDQYVQQTADDYLRKLKMYQSILGFPNIRLFRYEDVYYDKRKFLSDIFTHFQIDVSVKSVNSIAETYDVRPVQEDATRHIRKGTPGDHRGKLKPSTIIALNDKFREVCVPFGYSM